MTSTTVTPGRTIRTIRPLPEARNRWELIAWLFMRYSGLALIFLALSHFWMQHLLIGTHAIEIAGTQFRWGVSGQPVTVEQVTWRLYYSVLLVLAVTHGINGVRQVVYDYFAHRPGVYKAIMAVIVAIAVLISLSGIAALFYGVSSSAGLEATP